jgi:hypothetical protein
MALPRKKRFPSQHFSKDAPCTSNVNLFVIALPRKDDLRGPVTAGWNVARHVGFLNSRQPKIANLDVAIFIDQNVPWRKVTVNHTSRMNILQAALSIWLATGTRK